MIRADTKHPHSSIDGLVVKAGGCAKSHFKRTLNVNFSDGCVGRSLKNPQPR